MIDPKLRILVTADLGASADAPERLVEDAEAVFGAAFAAFAPLTVAGAPHSSLHDFSPEAIRARIGDAGDIDAVLHAPALVAVEARWRAFERFASCATAAAQEHGREVEIVVVPSTAADFAERLIEFGLAEADAHPSQGFDLVVVDHALGGRPGQLTALGRVAEWCAALGTPLVAEVDPLVFGVRHALHLATLPDFAGRLESPKNTELAALRAHPCSRWISLVIGRYLTRPAWVDSQLPHVEKVEPERPETLPFGSAAWLAASGMVRSLCAHGHLGRAAGFGLDVVHTDLGSCRVPGARGADAPETSTNVQFDDGAATALLRYGLSPLLDRPSDGVAAFPMITTLHRPAGPSLTRDESMAHQAHAGAALRLLLQLEGEARERGGSPETADWLRDQFVRWYAAEEGAVDVEYAEGTLHIALHPGWLLDGKPVDTELHLPVV